VDLVDDAPPSKLATTYKELVAAKAAQLRRKQAQARLLLHDGARESAPDARRPSDAAARQMLAGPNPFLAATHSTNGHGSPSPVPMD